MKKKFYGALLVGSLLLAGGMVSCSDYDDDINSLSGRVDALEKTVADLKTAIESGSVITNVQSTENGVTVTLSDGKTFEVKNGTNGTNGADGAPGSVVTIDEEGYWCIDGVRQTDKNGNAYKAQSEKGQDGQDGKDGCWYMPNEDGYWHKQYYNEDGTVADEATDNKWTDTIKKDVVCVVYDSENGRLLISNAEGLQEGEVVVIETWSELKSLAVIPYVIDKETSLPVVSFYNIVKDGNVLESTDATAHFRLNPNNANIKDWEWSIIDRKAVTRAEGDNVNNLLAISEVSRGDGEMIVSLKSKKSISDLNADEIAIFALNGTNTANGNNIASDYAKVTSKDLKTFAIINPTEAPEFVFDAANEYPTDIEKIDKIHATFAYTGAIDLKPLVATWVKDALAPNTTLESLNIDGLTYEFSLPETYLGSDKITNQQDFIVIDNGVVSVNNEKYPNGEAAIGRTPIVEVVAKVNGVSVASAYIKLSIVKEAQTPQAPFIVYVSEEPIKVEYSSIETGKAVQGFTWERMNREVYDVLKLSREEFIEKYITKGTATIEYKDVNGKTVNGVTIQRAENMTGTTTTNILDLILDATKIPSSVTGTATITYTPENTLTDRPIQIVFKYAVSHNHVSYPDFNSQFVDVDNALATIKGQMINNVWTQKVEISEHFLLDSYKADGNHEDPVLEIDQDKLPAGTTYELTGTTLENQVLTLTSEINGNYLDIPVNVVIALDNKERICVKSYTIRFVNPLRLTVDAIKLTAPFPGRKDEKNITFVVKDTEGRTIITNGTVAANNIYGIAQDDVTVTYSEGEDWSVFGINNDTTQKLTLNENTPSIKWENKGTALAKPVNTTYKVKVTVDGIAIMTEEGAVTVTETDM